MIKSDRSRYECGQRCARERYWNYHHVVDDDVQVREGLVQQVPGIVPETDSLDQVFGLAIHETVETGLSLKAFPKSNVEKLMHFQSEELTSDGESRVQEYISLFDGLEDSFEAYTLPTIIEKYKVICTETEHTMELGHDIRWMSRLDAVLRRKSDSQWFVLEVKTSSYPEELMAEASTNFQMLMEVEAMRRQFSLREEQVGGAMLLVFNKGRKVRDKKTGLHRMQSPFTYVYEKEYASGEVVYSPEWKSGWERVPFWIISSFARTNLLSLDVYHSQVQLLNSVEYSASRVASVIEQIKNVENRYDIYRYEKDEYYEALDWCFPQNFRMCNNSGGFKRECPYKSCCFTPSVASNPFAAGFEPREPNHPQEKEK